MARWIVALLLIFGTSSASLAQPIIEVEAATDNLPLVTLEIRGTTFSSPNEVEVLAWTREGDEIRVYVDYHVAASDDVVSDFRRVFMIPAPPRGEYELVFLGRTNAETAFREAARRSVAFDWEWPNPHVARTAFLWPPDPTPLDEVSYYFPPFNACQGDFFSRPTTNQSLESDAEFRDVVFIEQSRQPCETSAVPELASVELGRLQAGTHRLDASFQFDDVILDPEPRLDTRRFRVRATLPGRLSGSWYNPEQSGHGLSLEVLEEGNRLLAYWFTFDDQGEQAWVLADGSVDESGTVVEMDATLFTGGRFPPDFDPDDVAGTPWGSITLAFSDCNTATMSWDARVAGFSDGSMPVERLSSISGNGCDTPPPASLLENRWRLLPYPVIEESAEPPA